MGSRRVTTLLHWAVNFCSRTIVLEDPGDRWGLREEVNAASLDNIELFGSFSAKVTLETLGIER